MISANVVPFAYLVATVLFILSLRWMNDPKTARHAVNAGVAAMLIAVGATWIEPEVVNHLWIVLGIIGGVIVGIPLSRVPLTAVPQRTALSHAFGGAAAGLVGVAYYYLWWSRDPGHLTPFRTAALLRFAAEREAVRAAFGARRRRRTQRASDPTDEQLIAEALAFLRATYADDGDFTAAWEESFTPLVGATLGASSAAVAASIGLDWSLANPLVTAAVRARVNKLAGGVTETTYAQIQAVVEQARAAGLGIRDIANAIRETVFSDEITTMRAVRIARTETIGAMNAGEMLAAMNSHGALRSKEWLTQEDDKVRDSHAAQDRVRRDLSQAFPNGLQYPGDQNGSAAEVINCRCTLLYSDLEAPA